MKRTITITRRCSRCRVMHQVQPRFSQVQILCGCGQTLTRHDNTIIKEDTMDREELFSFLKWILAGTVLVLTVAWLLAGMPSPFQ